MATLGFAGVTTIDESVAEVTVSVVEAVTPPKVALMEELPAESVEARPLELIVATLVVADAQVTLFVMFAVELSEYVPVAANCWVMPFATDGFVGVMAIETSDGATTIREVEPAIEPELADTTVVPCFRVVARPVAEIVATVVSVEPQVTEFVMICVVLSLYVPVAVNCGLVPSGAEEFAGVTAIETSAAAVTVSVVDPLMPPRVAVIEDVPVASVEASPDALIVATVGVAEAQVTELVRFCVEVSVYVPVAVNCSATPLATDGLPGVTAMETRVGAVTVSVVELEMLPRVALMLVEPVASVEARPAVLIVATAGVADAHVTDPVMFWVVLSV